MKLTLNPVHLSANVDGEEIKLSGMEYQIMSYFAQNANVSLSRDRIRHACWPLKDDGVYRFSNIVDVYVNYLRKKGIALKAVRGIGYMLEVEK